MSDILLVGGSGMMGTYTLHELCKQGHTVHVMDLKAPYLQRPDTCIYYEIDVRDGAQVWNLFENENFDAVYYFAAVIRLDECYADPIKAWDTNVGGLITLLQCAAKRNVRRFIFPSTVHLYGYAEEGKEDAIIDSGASMHIYSASKLAGEMLVKTYNTHWDLPYTILRYGIAYGPGYNEDLVLHKFIQQAHNKEELTIGGDGKNSRDFLHVTDHARGNVLALKPEAENQIINLGGPESVTLNELVDIIRDEVASGLEVVYVPNRPSDYKGKQICNDKAKELIGWEPKVNLREGIRKYHKWVQSL